MTGKVLESCNKFRLWNRKGIKFYLLCVSGSANLESLDVRMRSRLQYKDDIIILWTSSQLC